MEIKVLTVTEVDSGIRLDLFLAGRLTGISRSKINNLIKKRRVLVDGEAKKPGFPVRCRQKVSVALPESPAEGLLPYGFTLKILYEDDCLIVIDKPAGLISHPPHRGQRKTVINALVHMNKELSNLNPLRQGIVHRLDKETSGVMVLAKTNSAHLDLTDQFKRRAVKKEYRAVCLGVIKEDVFSVNLPITRQTKDRLKMKVGFVNAKQSFTKARVLKRFNGATYLSLELNTGRTHQIRVHLSFLGFPVAGDRKYGRRDGFRELMLHAYKLGFWHPRHKRFVEFKSPLPRRFTEFIKGESA